MDSFVEVMREHRAAVAALKATLRRARATRDAIDDLNLPVMKKVVLLRMAEALIEAHKAAKIDNDGYTLDLVEDALRHVGERLAGETADGRNFSRKRLRHL